jgi:hypothetical protein
LQVPANWHAPVGAHGFGLPPTHAPLRHTEPSVHGFPVVHCVPSGAAGFEQPVAGLQTPATWHGSSAVHATGVPPPQTPFVHVSPCLHRFPSVHAVPSGWSWNTHCPVASEHTPLAWQPSGGVQLTGVPTQAPFWHASPVVHRLPSLQAVPFTTEL